MNNRNIKKENAIFFVQFDTRRKIYLDSNSNKSGFSIAGNFRIAMYGSRVFWIFKSQVSLFAGYGETVKPRKEEASAKFCSFYLACILRMLFFKSYKFPENNPLPCVFACLTWVVDVARIRLGEFVETLYSE